MSKISRFRAEHVYDQFVEVAAPRLSWQVVADTGNWIQQAYQLRIERGGVWVEAEKVASPDQVLLAWPFAPLASREIVNVSVRVWGPDGESEWSEPLLIEAGLLERSDWKTGLVQPPRLGDDKVSYLRAEFAAPKVAKARLYITAQGVYKARINGVEVSEDRMSPGWTSYSHRLRYQIYDVTALVKSGSNAAAVQLADGWYAGRLGWWKGGLRHNYGEKLGLIFQLELTDEAGNVAYVTSDAQWKAGMGGILETSIYDGETFDANQEPEGWDAAGFDDSSWSAVEIAPLPDVRLVGPQSARIKVVQDLEVARYLTSPSGKKIADLGQVITGHLRLTLKGAPGSTVTL
ncbi:MAG: alpha-L-rhamnosidase N-terminal domain-containing protein, partial [Propionibacteriaceae bacterium]|nr:alpha-L-rhamnosidase N-terminal domain-containing protein [Propionibacteriaceae bacterium]